MEIEMNIEVSGKYVPNKQPTVVFKIGKEKALEIQRFLEQFNRSYLDLSVEYTDRGIELRSNENLPF